MAYLRKEDLFPHLAAFPEALPDLKQAPETLTDLRLVSRVKNFEDILRLSKLKRLWCFGLNDKQLGIVSQMSSLERLYVEGFRIEKLAALARLPGLVVLSVDSATKVLSLAELERLATLRGLSVVNFPKVPSLSPLRGLRHLEALVVAGSIWTRMTVDTLTPVAELGDLRYLNLTNLKARDESLEPLSNLQSLEVLDLPNFYPVAEFARLAARLKHTRCTWFDPVTPLATVNCRKCESGTLVMLTGKGKPLLCSRCDESRLKEHEDTFNALKASAS
jgi:hypothetical protein